jgi:hypothetical protein
MVCLVCRHPERKAIDEQIQRRVSRRAIARHWGLSEASVRRHAQHGDKLKNPEVQELVKKLLALGMPRKLTAHLVGMDYPAFRTAVDADERFAAQAAEAEAKLAQFCLSNVAKAAQGDWRAGAWILEKTWPQYFGKVDRHDSESRSGTLTIEYVKAIRIALGVEDPAESALPASRDREAGAASCSDGPPDAVDALPASVDARDEPPGASGEGFADRLFDGHGSLGDKPGD